MIRFKNVIVLVSSLFFLTPLLASSSGCASKSGSKAAPKKGGGAKGPAAAQAKQKPGAKASGAKGVAKGPDLEGSTCNAETEGVAWCDSDSSLVLCSAGTWYAVDCTAIGGDVCATDLDTETVDCYAVADVQ